MLKYKYENDVHEHSKTNEPQKCVLNLLQKSSITHVVLHNLSIYYTKKDIRQPYKNYKLKIIAPTWKDEFELTDSSYSAPDIQDYIEYIIKKDETLNTNHPILIYINRINN